MPGLRAAVPQQGSRTTKVHTLFGSVAVPNPRWIRCRGQAAGPKTFRPTATWLSGRRSPELLYLETEWASLIPVAKVRRPVEMKHQ